ncbi:MAG: hypothetical protein ACTSWD_00055 [Candidatus Heimdallarchaeota archaeon]
MKQLWSATSADILEVMKRAKANGKKPGDNIEEEFLAYMKEKNKKPFGHTELSKEELIEEAMTKNNSVLHIDTDKNGKTKYISYKKKKE